MRKRLANQVATTRAQVAGLDPTVQGMLWTTAAGLMFVCLNSLQRVMSQQLDPLQAQFLRYGCGLLVMLPLVLRAGFAAYRPQQIGGQFVRGAVHTIGLLMWYSALPHIPLADMTAIGFTGPIFIMLGAYLFFKEPMHWDRWLASIIGFLGVLIVVGPKLSGVGGQYNLLMLASAPVFAASFLLTKSLTRRDSAQVIVVWQSISVTLLSLPFALPHWQHPTALQWVGFMVSGVLGSAAHYCLARSFAIADISSTQSIRFLDLVWSALFGWMIFSDVPSQTTLVGGVVICAATVWIARREAGRRAAASDLTARMPPD